MSTFSVYKGFKFSTYDKFFIFTDQIMNITVDSDSFADIIVKGFNNAPNPIDPDTYCHAVVNFNGTNMADLLFTSGGAVAQNQMVLGPGCSVLLTAPKSSALASGLIEFEIWRYVKANIY